MSTVMKQESKKTRIKRYRCQYCGEMHERNKLIEHIGTKHEDQIPDGYTATRIVFNQINKKDIGRCVICGRETPWNDDINRYEKYCIDNNGLCKDKAAEIAEINMKNKLGMGRKERMSSSSTQTDMLNNRTISGTYTFSTGGKRTYVGSYEKKLLEFLDTVMNMKSIHIQSPGPVIEYMDNGVQRFWITDMYIDPFNLAIDVKDGGNNPNKRDMPEYRAKQELKEKAIADQGVYNYIRLTDNNFAQLIEIMMDIKDQNLNSEMITDKVIRINEAISILIPEEPKFEYSINESSTNTVNNTVDEFVANCIKTQSGYAIVYSESGSFDINYAISDRASLSVILCEGDNGLQLKNEQWLNTLDNYAVYKYNVNESINRSMDIENILEMVTNLKIQSLQQLDCDDRFIRVPTLKEQYDMKVDAICNTLTLKETGLIQPFLKNESYGNVNVFKLRNGIYLENTDTGFKSGFYDNVPGDYVFELISKGYI